MPKPPRDTAQKWLAFGAIVVVAVGVSFASSAFKNHLKGTLPEPAPPDPRPTSSPRPTPVIAVTPDEADDEALPADDPRVPPTGTPKSSLAATPIWGHFDVPLAGDKPTMHYAPVHSRAAEIFATAHAPSEGLSRAFVICRGRGRDGNIGDVHVRATFGGMPEIAADGPTRGNVAFVSAPLIDLRVGQPIVVRVSERRANDLIDLARLSTKPGEKVFALHTLEGNVQCVALSGDDLQERIAKDAGRADSAISRIWAAQITVDASKRWAHDFPAAEGSRAQRRIADLAALVGWDDARVKKRVVAYDTALGKVDAEEQRVFETLRKKASNETTVGGLKVVLDSISCTAADPDECEVKLWVTNETSEAKAWRFDVDTTFVVQTKTELDPSTDSDDTSVEIAPQQRVQVVAGAPKSVSQMPAIAQFCARGGPQQATTTGCGVIRLH